jgi:hypothetical protein
MPEVNRAFSAGALFVSPILGRCPRLYMRQRLWRNHYHFSPITGKQITAEAEEWGEVSVAD